MKQICVLAILLIVTALLASSCTLIQPSPLTRLYTLTARAQIIKGQQTTSMPGVAIGVGPVKLPEYLDRPQIMTGYGSNELRRAEFEQWAEPLGINFTRILAANLATQLKTERIAVFPWYGPVPLDYQVVVEVTQFIGTLNGAVSLSAQWRVLGKNAKEVLISRQSHFTDFCTSDDYHALVSAMSRMIASLSADIAATITTFGATNYLPL